MGCGVFNVHGGLGHTKGCIKPFATDADRIGLNARCLTGFDIWVVVKPQLGDIDDDPSTLNIRQDEASWNGYFSTHSGHPNPALWVSTYNLLVAKVVTSGNINQSIL